MGHPHKNQAKSASTGKMRAIIGKGGGGSAYLGMSPFKRANTVGEQQSYNSHSKGYESGYAHGGAVKARGDRRARGGATHGEKINKYKIRDGAHGAPKVDDAWGDGAPENAYHKGIYQSNKSKLSGKTPGHFAKGGRAKHKGDVNIVIMSPHKQAPGGPGMGAGASPGQGLTGSPSPTPPPVGGPPGAAGGMGQQPNPQAAQALQAIAGGGMGMGGLGSLGAGMKADGGRTYQVGGSVHRGPPAGGGMGTPYGMPGQSDREWGGEPSENAKGGRTSFKFRKGGATWIATRDSRAHGGRLVDQGGTKAYGPGVMPKTEKHWAEYSDKNRKSEHGNSGESRELSLANQEDRPEHSPGGKKPIRDMEKRARGGRLNTRSKTKGGKPGAGQQTGEARLQQYRKGIF